MQLSYFDVVDENDEPTNKVADFDEIHTKGLWHRGVHVVIYTPDRQIVMQKRAPSLLYHPNEIEVSVGGGVDAGEMPVQAAVREVKEELGIDLSQKELHFIGKTKFNHRTKVLISRTFLYSYSVCVPIEKLQFITDTEETSAVFMIKERKLRAALRRHRIKKFGKISGQYAYWKYLLDSIPQ